MLDWSGIRYFKPEEFACKCGCGANRTSVALVMRLDELRHRLGVPLRVSSGYRCPEHNQRVSTTGTYGPHTTGYAVDILVSGRDAYRAAKIAFELGFPGIGVSQKGDHGARFLHLDLLPDAEAQPRPWMWSY